jgi:hypothetical protein
MTHDYRACAAALTHDYLPNITADLVTRTPHGTLIRAAELRDRLTWITALERAARDAALALIEAQSLLAYPDTHQVP